MSFILSRFFLLSLLPTLLLSNHLAHHRLQNILVQRVLDVDVLGHTHFFQVDVEVFWVEVRRGRGRFLELLLYLLLA